MEELYLPYNTRFIDRERNKTYQGPGKFEVEDDAVDHYLDRRWEWPDEADEEDDEDETTASEEGDTETNDNESEDVESEAAEVVETPEANPQEEYTRQELEEMSYEQLRTMASKSEREDVTGRSGKQDIIDAFASGESEDE